MMSCNTSISTLEEPQAKFQHYVERWYSEDDRPPISPLILKSLEGCDDTLPPMYCEMLDLPVGSTYDDSVDVFAPAGIYKLDLHGYPVIEALELAEDIVHQCWLSGFDRITIIHGSPNIRNRMQSQCMGRGGIKWGLRSLLYQGDWSRYVYPRRSAKHFIDDGYMVLALRPA